MELNKATDLAVQLFEKHGVSDYSFKFMNRYHVVGLCIKGPQRKEIKLSIPYIQVNSELVITEIILHEIAHALELERFGKLVVENGRKLMHGPRWRAICRELGIEPNVTCNLIKGFVNPETRYKYELFNIETGEVYKKYYKKPKSYKYIKKCIYNNDMSTLGKLAYKKLQ